MWGFDSLWAPLPLLWLLQDVRAGLCNVAQTQDEPPLFSTCNLCQGPSLGVTSSCSVPAPVSSPHSAHSCVDPTHVLFLRLQLHSAVAKCRESHKLLFSAVSKLLHIQIQKEVWRQAQNSVCMVLGCCWLLLQRGQNLGIDFPYTSLKAGYNYFLKIPLYHNG